MHAAATFVDPISEIPRVSGKARFKFLMIGDAFVGKTSIAQRFSKNEFNTECMSTLGIDFTNVTIPIDDVEVKLQIWDTGGQERFRSITSTYFRRADGIVLTYDVTNRASFEHVESWISYSLTHSSTWIPTVLLANKIDDMAHRAVSQQEGVDLATRLGITMFYEVSARESIGVNKPFLDLARVALRMKGPGYGLTDKELELELKQALSSRTSTCCI